MIKKTLNAPCETSIKPMQKPGIRFWARMKERGETKGTIKLLKSALASTNGTAREKMLRAVVQFASLDAGQQEKVLGKTGLLLYSAGENAYDSDYSANKLQLIAEFLSAVSQSLPKDRLGIPEIGALFASVGEDALIGRLQDAVARNDPHYAEMRLACLAMMKDLYIGTPDFWEMRVRDPYTREMAIGFLLGIADDFGFQKSGWQVLRQNMNDIAEAVGLHPCQKKIEFVRASVKGNDPDSVASGFKSALYIDDETDDARRGDFRKMADAILANGQKLHLHEIASEFICIIDLEEELTGFDIKDRSAGERIRKLVDNLMHTRDCVGASETLMEHAGILAQLIARNDSGMKFGLVEKMLAQKEDAQRIFDGLVVMQVLETVPDCLRSLASEVLQCNGNERIVRAAEDALTLARLKDRLSDAGDLQFRSAAIIIEIYQKGRHHIRPVLFDVAVEMADVYLDNGLAEETRGKALEILAVLALLGVQAPQVKMSIEVEGPAEGVRKFMESKPAELAETKGSVSGQEFGD